MQSKLEGKQIIGAMNKQHSAMNKNLGTAAKQTPARQFGRFGGLEASGFRPYLVVHGLILWASGFYWALGLRV